jgi:hypothetical protein
MCLREGGHKVLLQNMMIEKMQKLSFRRPPFLYHGCPVCGKTAANSWPTVLLFVVVMTPMMAIGKIDL